MDARDSSGLVPQAKFPGLLGAQLQTAVEHALPWYIQTLLRNYPTLFIAGGFIRDAAVQVPYHDIDIYLGGADVDGVSNWLQTLQPDSIVGRRTERGLTLHCPVTSFNTDGTGILWEPRQVQLLHSASVVETVAKFDLDNCTAAIGPRTLTLSYGPEFSDGMHSGICTAARDRINPRTYHRMERMKKQGWQFVEEDAWLAYDCFSHSSESGRDSG